MGHIRLGRLPRTPKWCVVVALLDAGAPVDPVAEEQRGWIDRCLDATEAADGAAPGFDTDAGAL